MFFCDKKNFVTQNKKKIFTDFFFLDLIFSNRKGLILPIFLQYKIC
jgi:hypothetical protein